MCSADTARAARALGRSPSARSGKAPENRYTYEAIDGLFRHDVYDDAVALTTGHIRDMQRTYGFTIFPEAWSKLGGPWGDQVLRAVQKACAACLVSILLMPGFCAQKDCAHRMPVRIERMCTCLCTESLRTFPWKKNPSWLCPAPGRGRTPCQGPGALVGRGAARDRVI